MKIVGSKTRYPVIVIFNPGVSEVSESIPINSGLSTNDAVNNNEIENKGIAHSKNLLSCLKNGNAIKNAANGKKRNCIPPHDVRPNVRNIPAKIIFMAVIFPLLFFIADKSKYMDRKPKNNPRGSDLYLSLIHI